MKNKKLTSKEVFNNIINVLKDLHKKHPGMDVCRHISDATAEFPNLWGVTNKEFSYQIEKYMVELDNSLPSDKEIDQIYQEASDLDHILDEQPEDEEYC